MAGSTIKGDIQRNGFLDKSGDGVEGQVRTLNASDEEVWATPVTGAHVIQNPAGNDVTQRGNLQFAGTAVTSVVDDSANDRTIVNINRSSGANLDCIDGGTFGLTDADLPLSFDAGTF